MEKTLLVAADYSQLELRVSAYMSQDKEMIGILQSGRDCHVVTAAAIYGCREEDVTDPMRFTAKTVNYLTSYGGQADKLIMGIEKMVLEHPERGLSVPSLDEAKEALRAHRRLYQQYWRWVEWTTTRAKINEYSETAFGRPRYSEFINSPNPQDRSEAERALVNHCIQGTAADLIKMAMVNISRDELMNSWGQLVLQVHDELVAIVDSPYVVLYSERINKHMQLNQPFMPYVELKIDVNHGETWRDTHK